jgi:micrococcal nuclease
MRLSPKLPSLASVVILIIVIALLVTGGDDDPEPALEKSSSQTAAVTRVVDGDTVEVRIDGVVEDLRYIGVDTPESVKPDTPVECFGPEASEFNSELVEGETVRLVYDAERRDVYERLLAYVYVGNTFVNAELVRRGYATTLTIAPNDRFAAMFDRLEREASAAGRGLWGEC